MKFTDLNKDMVTEAPDLSKIKGKLQRAGTKLKKHTPFSKETRAKATAKSKTQQTGLKIKDQFHSWVGGTGSKQTVKDFKGFIEQTYPNLAPFVDKIAVALKFTTKKPKPEPDPEATPTPDDSTDQQVEPTVGGDEEDMISPEEMTGEKDSNGEQSEEEIRAAYGPGSEFAKDVEAEGNAAEEADESVEEDANDAEPKVDMSASIYESKLNYLLLLEKALNDNELDTLIVRVLQAAAKSGKQKPEAEKGEIGKAADKISNATDDSDDDSENEYTASGRGNSSVLDEYADELEDILATVANGKDISDNQKGYARAILDEL